MVKATVNTLFHYESVMRAAKTFPARHGDPEMCGTGGFDHLARETPAPPGTPRYTMTRRVR